MVTVVTMVLLLFSRPVMEVEYPGTLQQCESAAATALLPLNSLLGEGVVKDSEGEEATIEDFYVECKEERRHGRRN